MTRMKNIYLFLLSLIIFISCSGQVKTNPTITEGQPKIKKNHFIKEYPDEYFFVQCGLEDKAGNMWFGSAGDGIYFYDGKTFLNFTKNDGLCHNDILCCREDKSGTIWFGTRNGVIRYKPSGKRPEGKDFTTIFISANTISYSTHKKIPYTYIPADNFVWSIMQDKTGKIWFGTNKGVYIYDPLNSTDDMPAFYSFLESADLKNNTLQLKEVTGMLEDKNRAIWLVSGFSKGEGICRYDGKAMTNFKPDSLRSFRSIIERKNGDLLFLTTFHGVYSYGLSTALRTGGKTFTNLTEKTGIKKDTLIAMIEDKSGALWFGCASDHMNDGGNGGVWRYDASDAPRTGSSLKKFTTKDGLSHNCVFCVVEDSKGNIWFGTRNTGLCYYNGKTFTDFTE